MNYLKINCPTMDETQSTNLPSSLNEMIHFKDVHTATDSPIYVEVGSLKTVFPTHPTNAQVSAVLKMTNHFKMNMILCGFWEKIDEETPEQLENYEKEHCENDLKEALKILERDSNPGSENRGPSADSENCNVEIVFGETKDVPTSNDFFPVSLPYVFYEPKKPEQFEFSEEDKEEFRQLFAEEAKILMPQLRIKQRSEEANKESPKKFNEQEETTILHEFKEDPINLETMLDEIILRTPVEPLQPRASRSSAINMPYSLDSSSIEGRRPRNYGTWYYVCLVFIVVACAVGYVLSRFFFTSN